MTDREYRAREGISRSELWRLNPDNGGSPEKFKFFQENPEEPTPALIFGQMAHKLLLEPESFAEEFAVAPAVDRRTKDGKAIYAAFLAGLKGQQEIKADDFEKASAMVDIVKTYPFVGPLLDKVSGEHEKAIFWTDPFTGIKCKARLDVLTWVNGTPIIVDYKTAADASTDGFIRHALKYGYDFQSAMYSEGVEAITGKRPRFVFIAQEKEAPYSGNVMEADELFIQRGKDKFRELLGIYAECMKTGNWYGYMGPEPVIEKLSLPAWAGGA